MDLSIFDEFQEKHPTRHYLQSIDSVDAFEITYWSDSLLIQGFVLEPKTEGTYPVIIYNRGGNRDFGELEAKSFVLNHSHLVAEGYVVIASNYRGGGTSRGEDEFGGRDVNDVLALFRVLPKLPKADTTRIGMYGWSRGGMMTYLALLDSIAQTKIKAAVVGAALSDLTIIYRQDMEDYVYKELIPNYVENKEEELRKRSVIYRLDEFPTDIPILMLHGDADRRVKVSNSIRLAEEFEKRNIPHQVKIYEEGSHGLREYQMEKDEEVKSWFERYLKNQ